MKKRLVVQGRLSDAQLATLNDLFDVSVLPKTTALNDPDNHALLAEVHGIIGSGLAITPQLLDAAPNLEVIATISVGYDNLPVEELTKRGYTRIVRKRVGPDWTPTPSMIERDPDLKYMPPGPDNPLGTHAMYLSWPAYLIHGTHDTRKIGRQSSDGCIGLYNHMIEALYQIAPIGTQVRIV